MGNNVAFVGFSTMEFEEKVVGEVVGSVGEVTETAFSLSLGQRSLSKRSAHY